MNVEVEHLLKFAMYILMSCKICLGNLCATLEALVFCFAMHASIMRIYISEDLLITQSASVDPLLPSCALGFSTVIAVTILQFRQLHFRCNVCKNAFPVWNTTCLAPFSCAGKENGMDLTSLNNDRSSLSEINELWEKWDRIRFSQNFLSSQIGKESWTAKWFWNLIGCGKNGTV